MRLHSASQAIRRRNAIGRSEVPHRFITSLLALLHPVVKSSSAGALPDICREPGIPSIWRLPAITPCFKWRRASHSSQDINRSLRICDERVKNLKSIYLNHTTSMTNNVAWRILVRKRMIYNSNKKLLKKLGIMKGKKIFGPMGVRLPAIRFQNKIMGKRMALTCNGGVTSK
jgi:hypothetical protein